MHSYSRFSVVALVLLPSIAFAASIDSPAAGAAASSGGVRPIGAYVGLGEGLGESGIGIAPVGNHIELFTSSSHGFQGDHWVALRRNSDGSWEPFFASALNGKAIRRLRTGDVRGDHAPELVLGESDGTVELFDTATKAKLGGFDSGLYGCEALTLADLDGDGQREIVICTTVETRVFRGDGTLLASFPGIGGYDVAVGQMDADAGLEIAFSSGAVIDYASRSVQCTRANGFGVRLAVSDFDGDGMDELVFVEPFHAVYAWDVDTCQEKWHFSVFDPMSLALIDVDHDGTDELLLGAAQSGDVDAYSLATQQKLWTIVHADSGFSDLALADVDQDGADEFVWAAGLGSSGADHLYVIDAATHAVEWHSVSIDGPWIGPALGDLDGDGYSELVAGGMQSENGYGGGRFVVLDPQSLHTRALSPVVASGTVFSPLADLKLVELDGTPGLEILVGSESLGGAWLEAWDYGAGGTLTRIWQNTKKPKSLAFERVAAADLDGDGSIEVVGATRVTTAPGNGATIYVYDGANGTERWRSASLFGPYQLAASGLELAQTDDDPALEIVVVIDGGDAFVLDGATRQIEASWTGPFRALAVQADPSAGKSDIWLGDWSGNVTRYRHGPSGYVSLGTIAAANARIDGLTPDRLNSTFVANAGTLRLEAPLGSANTIWSTSGYGVSFGRRVLSIPQFDELVAAGDYGVFALRQR